MNLKHLTDEQLLKDTEVLAGKEREITVEMLYHLYEIDKRKLYCDLKFQSLFDYCVKKLKYSDGGAQRRISSARLLHDVPLIAKKVKNGELTLTNTASAAKFIKEKEIKDPEKKKEIITSILNLSKKECDQKLFELGGGVRPKTTSLIIEDETYVLIQKARSMMAVPISQDELIKMLIQEYIEKVEKNRFKQTVTDEYLDSLPLVEVNCVISAKTKRFVYVRDGGRCVNCGSIHNLHFDHRIARALGGKNTADNIRLLCFNCNQRSRILAKL